MKKILELGSCSMLDHEYDSSKFIIDKLFHKNTPINYHNLLKWDQIKSDYDLLGSYDIYILSTAIRDSDDVKFGYEARKIVDTNIDLFNIYLMYLLELAEVENKLIISMGSISANEDQYYIKRPFYAATKAYQRSLFKNVSQIYNTNKFIEFELPSVKTRMCNHGLDSKVIFDRIMEYCSSDLNSLFQYKIIKL